jgi:C4-dicarboxylate-specific signal transduction histidine kinase
MLGNREWPRPVQNSSASAISIRVLVRSSGIALIAVAAALVFTLLLQRLFLYPFLFLFFGAVMVSGWFAGTAAGLFAVVLSTLAVDYFFVPPLHSFSISTTAEAYFVAFVLCAFAASWISSSKRSSEEALKHARDQLEARVSERTAELMKTQAELARLSQVMTMGELAASIAHEISQPLTAVVTHGHACAEWLSASPPNLEKARQTLEKIIQDGSRAGDVLGRIRALFKMEPPAKSWLNVNELIDEMKVFFRDEAARRRMTIVTDLSPTVPKVRADNVQLQQVLLNLMVNGMDSMTECGGPKELVIGSRREGSEVVVTVKDSGVGLDAGTTDKIFNPFFTTKEHGIGVGLSICRSIIESHHGRMWASPRPSGGAIFQFTLPIAPRESDG